MVKVKGLRAVFIHPDLGIGGAERLMLDLAIALCNQGIRVNFITNHFDPIHSFEELKNGAIPVQVIGDWIPRSVCGVFQAFFAYIRMIYLTVVHVFQLFGQNKPDVYYVDQIPMAVPVLKWFGAANIVYYCHHPDLLASSKGGILKQIYRKPINAIEEYGTSKSDIILVNSVYTGEIFKCTFKSIQDKEQFILYPTIADSYIKKLSTYKKVAINKICPELQAVKSDEYIFLSVNRYHPAKDLELAINALAELRLAISAEQFSKLRLIIAGGFDPENKTNAVYFRKLVELTHSKDLVVKVIFLKSPSEKVKTELLMACNCLLYTPTNEHFGIVPLEAMAAGKAVIACNSGGPMETVVDKLSGYLCENNPSAMAQAMMNILDMNKANKMGSKGLERLHSMFSYEKFCERAMAFFFIALYRNSPSQIPDIYKTHL